MTAATPLCVIGGGQIGERHIEVALACPEVTLTAVVEPYAARRDQLRDMGLPVVATIAEVPEHTRAAIIATPTPDHAGAALAALDRGWAVIVEKPLAGSLAEARQVIARAEARGLPVFTGHHRRCHPFSIAARDRIRQLGDLVGVQALWSLRKHDSYYDVPWRREPGAGPLLQNLSHEVDLLHFLMGPIDRVSALVSSDRRGLAVEDTAALSLHFANGALGSVLMSDAGASPWAFEAASGENPMLAASGQDYLRIVGTRGALEFPSLRLWLNGQGGETEWRKPLTAQDAPAMARVDPLLEQMRRFARVVATGQPDDILCSGSDGLAALEITLATALSGHTGQPVGLGQVGPDYRGV